MRDEICDRTLKCALATAAAQDRASTALLVAHIAEFDARGLYRPAGYSSMHLYCEHELHLSKDATFKRIQVARAARVFPSIFEALADGRLHLTGAKANLLAAHLKPENADELLRAAFHKSKLEIEQILAERFPRTELIPLIVTLPTPPTPEHGSHQSHVKDVSCQLAPAQVGRVVPPSRVAPLAAQRFELRLSMGKEMNDDLRYAQELLGHQVPSGDVAQVIHRGIKALIRELEKKKFAATTRPKTGKARKTTDSRYVPAEVRRTVAARDGAQCTFTTETGRRCQARKCLEFDHIVAFARGGQATEDNLRLRCRTHNQYTAEQTYGAELMRSRREEAAEVRAQRAAAARAKATVEAQARSAAAKELSETLLRALRRLGFTADEARCAAAHCERIPEASMEQRMRAALSYLVPPNRQALSGRGANAGV